MKRVLATFALGMCVSACGGSSPSPTTPTPAEVVAPTSSATIAPNAAVGKKTRARSLSISFDIVPTSWAGQPDVYDPNLVFLEFRGGIDLSSKNAVATATFFVDDVAIGSTTGDDSCSLCTGTTWQFGAVGFPNNPIFQHPTIIDFTRVLNGRRGLITLTVDSGFMEFGAPPYTTNAPIVVFDYITCCTTIWPVTMDAQNLTYQVDGKSR